MIITSIILCVGLLSPVGATAVQYNTLDTVILQVNITPTATFTRDYLRALTWYHNGVEINYHYRNISLSSDNTTLTITNARQSDAGVHPHTARYYCQVYYKNQVFATGSTVITVQGRLHQSIR